MSVRAAPRGTSLLTGAVLIVGVSALLWRLRLGALSDPTRSTALGLLLGGVLVAALLVPVARERSGPRRIVPVVLGGLAVAAAVGAVTGPRPPVPWAATALPLAVLAAVGEEALFRRVLYDRLLRFGPVLAVITTAVGFALLHVPAYGWVAFPVDLGAGVLFGWQRHATGTWAAPAWTHAAINVGVMLR
jgi:membrane protease YdiL (CAAX protease family)